jgi:hypothetical protein
MIEDADPVQVRMVSIRLERGERPMRDAQVQPKALPDEVGPLVDARRLLRAPG